MEPVKRGCKHPGNMPLLGIALWIVISLLHMVPPCTQTLPDPEKGGQKGGRKSVILGGQTMRVMI